MEAGTLFAMGCSLLAPAATGGGVGHASQQGGTPTEFPAVLGLHLTIAWESRNSFTECTNMRAWLFAIMRNNSVVRMRPGTTDDAEFVSITTLTAKPEQRPEMAADLRWALAKLPDEQREALILLGASEFTYEEAAKICGCNVEVVERRVQAGRELLAQLLEPERSHIRRDLRDMCPTAKERMPLGRLPLSGVPTVEATAAAIGGS